MDCYYYETIHETDDPIFKNVDITIILIMENSTRFKPDPFLLNLTKKTIIQYNKGFRACKKPPNVNRSNKDAVYSYYTAFEYTKNYKNVLFLEEDAEVLYYDKEHYKKVDKYIEGDFKIFSFALNGVFNKIDKDFYHVDMARSAHAQIISKNERDFLSKRMKDNNFDGESDGTYFDGRCVAYKHPLIIQLFPETENFYNWSGNKYINKLGIILTGVETDKYGWEIIYSVNKFRGFLKKYYVLVIFIVLIFVIYLIITKKNGY